MAKDCGADYGIVVDNDFSGKLGGVADDATVAYLAVVGYVHVLHEEVAIAYHGLALAGSASTDSDILADAIVVADDAKCFLATELEVLGLCADACTGEKLVAVADACSSMDGDTVGEVVVVANLGVLVYIAERPDDIVVS